MFEKWVIKETQIESCLESNGKVHTFE